MAAVTCPSLTPFPEKKSASTFLSLTIGPPSADATHQCGTNMARASLTVNPDINASVPNYD
jgi:hypothetical protein